MWDDLSGGGMEMATDIEFGFLLWESEDYEERENDLFVCVVFFGWLVGYTLSCWHWGELSGH